MAVLTMTAKGQLTLNKALRRHLGAEPGTRLEVEERPGGEVIIRRAVAKRPISELFGILHRPGQRAVSVEEMHDAMLRDRADAYRREISGRDGK